MTLPNVFIDRPFAHRGLHNTAMDCAENSKKSILAAIVAGYGIEIDLQLSCDGVPMVFHDYSLCRLTQANGPIAQRSAAELGAINLLHDGGGIQTLSQVLNQIAGQVPLLIEFKDQDRQMGSNIGPLGRAAAEILRDYSGPYAVMSFNPHAVYELQHLLPETPRGIVTDPYSAKDWPTLPAHVRNQLRNISDYGSTGSCFISHNQKDLTAKPVTLLKHVGATILCWTVKSAKAEAHARKVADNITFEGYMA